MKILFRIPFTGYFIIIKYKVLFLARKVFNEKTGEYKWKVI